MEWNLYPSIKPTFDIETKVLVLVYDDRTASVSPVIAWYKHSTGTITAGYWPDNTIVAWCEIPNYDHIEGSWRAHDWTR